MFPTSTANHNPPTFPSIFKEFCKFPRNLYDFTQECLEYNTFDLEQNSTYEKKLSKREILKKIVVISLKALETLGFLRLIIEGLKGLNMITKDVIDIKKSSPFSAERTKLIMKSILTVFFIVSLFFSFRVGVAIVGVYYLVTTSFKIANDLMKKNYTEALLESARFIEKICFIAASILGGAEMLAGFVLFKVFYAFARAGYELAKNKDIEGYSFAAIAVLKGLVWQTQVTFNDSLDSSSMPQLPTRSNAP